MITLTAIYDRYDGKMQSLTCKKEYKVHSCMNNVIVIFDDNGNRKTYDLNCAYGRNTIQKIFEGDDLMFLKLKGDFNEYSINQN